MFCQLVDEKSLKRSDLNGLQETAMKKVPKQSAWIPIADYMERGVRKPKTRINPFADQRYAATFPETWVALEDHHLRGITKKRHPTNDAFIQRLKPLPPASDTPPEAYLTIFDALQEIWAVPKPNGAVFSRLKSMHEADRKEWNTGRIDDEEYLRRQDALMAIRVEYAAQAEGVTEWFLQNRFRLFSTLPNA